MATERIKRDLGVLSGPVGAPVCLALILLATSVDLQRGVTGQNPSTNLLLGIAVGSVLTTLALAAAARLTILAETVRSKAATYSRTSAKMSFVLAILPAVAIWWMTRS